MNTPVLDLLKDPSHWTQETFARTKSGKEVGPKSPIAVCWCLRGAIAKCYDGFESEAIEKLNTVLPNNVSMVHFNDTSTHEDIVNILEKAQI